MGSVQSWIAITQKIGTDTTQGADVKYPKKPVKPGEVLDQPILSANLSPIFQPLFSSSLDPTYAMGMPILPGFDYDVLLVSRATTQKDGAFIDVKGLNLDDYLSSVLDPNNPSQLGINLSATANNLGSLTFSFGNHYIRAGNSSSEAHGCSIVCDQKFESYRSGSLAYNSIFAGDSRFYGFVSPFAPTQAFGGTGSSSHRFLIQVVKRNRP